MTRSINSSYVVLQQASTVGYMVVARMPSRDGPRDNMVPRDAGGGGNFERVTGYVCKV